jgi:hypothetical protein
MYMESSAEQRASEWARTSVMVIGHAITPIPEASSATRMTLRREQPDGQ